VAGLPSLIGAVGSGSLRQSGSVRLLRCLLDRLLAVKHLDARRRLVKSSRRTDTLRVKKALGFVGIITFALLAVVCYQSAMAILQVTPNVEAEFTGVYVFKKVGDQGIGELYIDTGKKFLGIFTRRESWWPEFPPDFSLPAPSDPAVANLPFARPRFFQLRFLGIPGAEKNIRIGNSGRKRPIRPVKITRVLDVKEVSGM
jgi:hypothetical protein